MSEFNVTFGDTIENPYILPIASNETLGGVKIGENITIDENGVISVDLIGIGQGTIPINENTVVIDYTGILIGMMAWQGNDFVLTNLSCNISNNQITFTTNDNVTIPINCTVVYLKEG